MIDRAILARLNAPTPQERLAALEKEGGAARFPATDPRYVNNHIHTTYSFSPYSPCAAVYAAKAEGLATAGIMDHDSIGGAEEFIAAGKLMNFPVTVGMECRVSLKGTYFENLCTNNPDQPGLTYMAIHGVPHGSIDALQRAFAPRREARNVRNRAMVANINALLAPHSISVDFDRDVLPLSIFDQGGTVTERHLMLALARALVEKSGKGPQLCSLLADLGVELSGKQQKLLGEDSPYYDYDLLGVLKGAFIPKVFIPATDECGTLAEIVRLASELGAVLCYPYLGDVGDSVTGDKVAQKFEDEHIDQLFDMLNQYGIKAVTYMPTRNTKQQLTRLRGMCEKNGMFQISGEDVNTPRQSFICKAMEDPMFSNLIDNTWTLIDHELGIKPIY